MGLASKLQQSQPAPAMGGLGMNMGMPGGMPPQQPPPQFGGFPPQQANSFGTPPPYQQQHHHQSRNVQRSVPPPPSHPPPQHQQQQQQQLQPPHPQQVLQILQQCVRENGLEQFYPPRRLEHLAQTIGPQVPQIVSQWQIPPQLAIDLVKLSLYDIILFCDDSGSMAFEENGERIDDLRLIMQRVSYASALFDQDGIEVRFFNSNMEGNNIQSDSQVGQLMGQCKFRGLTPLGTAMKSKVIDPLVLRPASHGRLAKPALILTVTDGHPAGENSNTIFKVVSQTKHHLSRTPYGAGAIAFQFAQVGSDLKARDFLAKLDTDREIGRMIDCTSTYEVEQDEMARKGVELSPSVWIVKLMLGPIDRSYDEQDE